MGVFAVFRSDKVVAPMRAIRRHLFGLACLLAALIGASTAAEAACSAGDTTTGSQIGATITVPAAGSVVRLCVTDDVILYGLFGSSSGANPNIDAFFSSHLPMVGTGSFDPLNYTTSKATYTLTPLSAGASQVPEYTITVNTLSAAGTDTITLWYSNECGYQDGCPSPPATTNTSFTITVNLPAPSISMVTPASGSQGGGNTVTIAGANFTGITGTGGVKFGGVSATSYSVLSSTQISAVVPASVTVGAVDVTVTNSGVTATKTGGYTYLAAPAIISLSPSSGPETSGTVVTITGMNLDNASAVTFGGTPATFSIDSSTQIKATAPAGNGMVDVRVTTPGGTSALVSGDQYTYVPAPTVTSLSRASGPTAGGGAAITVTGTSFTGASAVTFGGATAVFTVVSPTAISVTAPAGSGMVDVIVTTAGGTSAVNAGDKYTYIPAPTITSISPNGGPTGGGTPLTITGSNFTGVTAVSFGGTAAAGFTFNSSTSISATSPAGSGTVDIRVTTDGGTSATAVADQFTYFDTPTISSITPNAGPLAGGTSVTITGINLSGATAVKFGTAAATSFSVGSSTSITATAPSGTGTVNIRATTPGGTTATAAASQFTYAAVPAITSINPTSGPAAGATTVIITGTDLLNATAVTFGGAAAASFSVTSATSISAVSPSGSGAVDIRVTTAGGTSAISAGDQFTYLPAPTVSGLSVTSGPAAGGTPVTITGTNFTGVTTVKFGTTAVAGFNVVSSTSITTTAPSGTGSVDVRVATGGGESATSAADQFTYIAAPTVTSITPTGGPLTGGTSVIITGTGFTSVTAVAFGSTAATTHNVVSPTSITATSPAGTGTVDIRVTAAGGVSADVPGDRFTYASVPMVTAVSPSSGSTAGGTVVTITGTNLGGATAVTFGATAATTYTVTSATSISATAPAGAVGMVDIRVTTPGGTTAISAADQFTYLPAPTVTAIAPNAGPAIGGTSVNITGTGLTGTTGATSVKFGTVNATSYTVNSATSITAIAPAGTGTVDVTVTNSGLTSATSAADQFSYNAAPGVSAISPASGPAAGGTSVTITGSGFAGTAGPAGVKFGSANAASYVVNSATTITAVSPAGTGTVDIIVTTAGQVSAASPAGRFSYLAAATQTTLASAQNPSIAGQPVTFTATVSSSGATPTGTVTFNDGSTAIGTATLTAGVATISTSALAAGVHTITARFTGSASFTASTSPALLQTVNVPIDSIRLRAMQLNVTKMIAQNSGQAASGAIFEGISEGFNEGGVLMLPSATSVRINFAAEPRDDDDVPSLANGANGGSNHASTLGIATTSDERGQRRGRATLSRIDDAFASIDRQAIRKAPPRWREQKEWLLWADIRTTGIDRWSSSTTPAGVNQVSQSSLYGMQVNALLGLTYKAAPNLLVGMVGGWETFSYTQQDINGRLRGDGWTVGGYLGWLMTPMLRYDAALTYSGIGYQGSAGAAQGNFNGQRWMFATGFTGSHQLAGFLLEPSLRVYALWEHQNAYTDTLGTLQGTHDFASGRASAGFRGGYPLWWFEDVVLTPYLGIYGDYYFSQVTAAPLAGTDDSALASTPLLQGWSARATAGLGSKFANGAGLLLGGELGGIGNTVRIWTLSAKARVPF